MDITIDLPLKLYTDLLKLAETKNTSIEKLITVFLKDRVKQEFAKNYKTA